MLAYIIQHYLALSTPEQRGIVGGCGRAVAG